LAAGVKCVVYIEPYPKSRVGQLHKNEIEIEKKTSGKVSFLPFLGISPVRYRDIFQRGKRKSSDGTARRYMTDPATPMMESASTAYIENESIEWGKLVVSFEPNDDRLDASSRST
jgi:cytidine deaminase